MVYVRTMNSFSFLFLQIVFESVELNMEEVLLRFPHLGEKILLSLDYQSLIKCRMVARHWKESMEVENSKYIRLIRQYTDCSDKLLKNVLKKSGAAVVMVSVLREIFRIFPRGTKQRHSFLTKWCNTPLHVAAKNGHLAAYELIMENVKDKNPHCRFYGRTMDHQSLITPLHLAAAEGHLKMYKLIFHNVKDFRPRDGMGQTPIHYAQKRKQIKMIQYIKNAEPTLYHLNRGPRGTQCTRFS